MGEFTLIQSTYSVGFVPYISTREVPRYQTTYVCVKRQSPRSSEPSYDFTAIVVRCKADVPRLVRVNEREFGGEANYRAVINFLVDYYEEVGDGKLNTGPSSII